MASLFSGIFLFLVCQTAAGQSLEVGVEVGPGIQTIEETQAVLSNGWQVAVMPQLALRVRYQPWEVFGVRAGLQYLRKGGRVPITSADYPDAPAAVGFLVVEGRYGVANLGIFARANPASKVRLEGMIDVAGGLLLQGVNRNSLYPRGHPLRVLEVNSLFNNVYLGVHIGGSVAWLPTEQLAIYLQPTLEAQLNNAFRSSVFVPRFIGFAPLLGLSYTLE